MAQAEALLNEEGFSAVPRRGEEEPTEPNHADLNDNQANQAEQANQAKQADETEPPRRSPIITPPPPMEEEVGELAEPLAVQEEGQEEQIDQAVVSDEDIPNVQETVYQEYQVTEARVDLYESHSLIVVAALIQSLDEGFEHMSIECHPDPPSEPATSKAEELSDEHTWLFDEYSNQCFVITYCMNPSGRDQLRVRWFDALAEQAHSDDALPDLTRRLARMMGGGVNLHLLDCTIRTARPAGGYYDEYNEFECYERELCN